MAWTSPRTWVSGETVTAALFNTHVRDNLKAIGDPWTSYTTTWTGATTNPVLNNGSQSCAYSAAGKQIEFRIQITMGSTTTYGSGAWRVTLPVTATSNRWTFVGDLLDASAPATYPLRAVYNSGGGYLDLYAAATTAGNPDRGITSAIPFTWATSDILFLSGTYEAA